MSDTISSLAQKLRPYWLRDVGAGGGVVSGGGGAMSAHALNGPYHTGTLDEAQAPWAVTDTEFATHTSNPDAHHARQHQLANASGLGPDHTISGAVAGWVLKATAANAARMAQLMVPELGAVGASWDVAALTATNTVGLRTPSSDVRGGAAEALLKSNAAGALGLRGLAVGPSTLLGGVGNAATEPDVLFASAAALLAFRGSAYLALDSDNNATGTAFVVGHNGDTTAFSELYRFGDNGTLRFTATAPTISTAANGLTIAPADSITLTPGASNRLYLSDGKAFRTLDFASGFTGYGFQLDQGITTAGKTTLMLDDLTVRGRMYVYEMLIRQIRATNGPVFVSSTAKVKRVGTVPGGYRLYTTEADETPTATTDHAHGFLPGDLIRAQRTRWNGTQLVAIYQSNMRVTTVDDLYTFRAVLESGDIPAPGMEFVRIGNDGTTPNRQGTVYLTSDDDSAPFVDVVDGVAAHSQWNTAGKIKVRLGKLTGITTITNEYGIIAGSGGFSDADYWFKASGQGVVLNRAELRMFNGGVNTGIWYANGQFDIGFDGISALNERDFTVHASRFVRIGRQTTNYPNLLYDQSSGYVALRSGTTDKIRLDANGDSYFAGVMTIGTNGEIRQGTGTLGSNYTGLRIWRDGNVGRIAGYNNNIVQWGADTLGRLTAGGGNVVLAASGIRVAPGAFGWSDIASPVDIAWVSGSVRYGSIGGGEMDVLGNAGGVQISGFGLASQPGVVRLSSYNAAGALVSSAALQGSTFTAQNLSASVIVSGNQMVVSGGVIASDNPFQFLNTALSTAQAVRVGSVLASNNYTHASRVPANGIYSLGAVAIGVTAAAAGVALDVGGQTYMRAAATLDGALYLKAVAAASVSAVTGYLPVFFDGANLRARLPDGSLRTISWTT